mmetsp:Transcript_80286/g.260170  ORF Transcript_80286/g.260170 Transcript_80286/m.260170 type:complete len:94 (-) Transcript_80286:183-464(-)
MAWVIAVGWQWGVKEAALALPPPSPRACRADAREDTEAALWAFEAGAARHGLTSLWSRRALRPEGGPLFCGVGGLRSGSLSSQPRRSHWLWFL